MGNIENEFIITFEKYAQMLILYLESMSQEEWTILGIVLLVSFVIIFIAGMTNSLGVAFNSTLLALLISIFLMFIFHQLQRLQDGQLVDIQSYCDQYLLARIK